RKKSLIACTQMMIRNGEAVFAVPAALLCDSRGFSAPTTLGPNRAARVELDHQSGRCEAFRQRETEVRNDGSLVRWKRIRALLGCSNARACCGRGDQGTKRLAEVGGKHADHAIRGSAQ